MGAGYIYAPGNFGGDYNVFDYSIRTWNIGPDHTDDIEREYRRHIPLHPMVFQFYIDPSGGIHDGGRGFKNLTGKPIETIIEYLHREDNKLHDGRDDIKINRLSALDEIRNVVSSFEPKIAHDLSWVKGQKGKGILLNDGRLITWPVNKKNNPDQLSMYEYLTGQKLPKVDPLSCVEGFPFDISPDGGISTIKETPDEALADINKIDYRLSLKESKTAADFWVPGGDVNMGYQAPDQGNPEYDYDTDKFRLKPQKEMMDDIDVGIENLNENELKQAVSNAIRIALLSPKQPLHGNAMVYQALLDVPYTETDPQPYIDAYQATKQKYDEGEDKFMAGDKVVNKMPSSMTRNLVFCAKAAEHLDGAVDAARKDLEAGGDGHIFRNWTMANITGMAGKTASFAWLLLNPNKSNLATVDTHMFRSLYPGYDELNTAEREAAQKELNKGLGYFMYERIFDARSKALGYPEGYKLGPTQWNFWDTIRSGESQPHDAFRTIDPTPAAEATWTTDAAPGSAQDISQVVPDWNQTQGAGMEVQNQFDQFHTELLQEAIKAGIFSAAKQYLSPEDINYISQVRPDILNGIVRQASAKKEFTKEDAFDLMDKLGYDFDGNEFWMGMNDELEHDWLTHGDPETTAKIVADHLREHPDYYSRLHNTFKTAALNEYVEMVPTEVLAKYAEYNEPISEEHLASLEEDIKTNGIQEPVVIDYDQDTGQAHISEGNHRILAAQNLGIESVPAFVYRSSRKGQRSMPADLIKEDSWADPFDPSGFRIPQYMKPSQIKIARPADPEWWGQQAQEDPYVYHVTSGENLQSIAQQGLSPWDETPQGTRYTDDLTPREGHIYFSMTPDKSRAVAEGVSNPYTLRVRRDQLDPNSINPDEDAVSHFIGKPDIPDYQVPLDIVDTAQQRLNEFQNSDADWDTANADYGYGAIAEEVGYGDNPEDTRRGIEAEKTLAYRGTVPPKSIEYQEYPDDPWQPITNLLQQQLSPTAKAAAWDKSITKLTFNELKYIYD